MLPICLDSGRRQLASVPVCAFSYQHYDRGPAVDAAPDLCRVMSDPSDPFPTSGDEYAYMFNYEDRLGTRLREWFISGMCERCQAVFHEVSGGIEGEPGAF